MKKVGKIFRCFVLWAIILIVPTQAYAAAAAFTCNGYSMQDADILDVATCEQSMKLDTIISSSICIMRAVLAESMFKVYCGIMNEVKPLFNALLTLWVIIYAISVMFGLGNAQAKDILIRVMKIVLIFTFAFNAEIFFLYMYKFFIYGILEGVSQFFFEIDPDNLNPGNTSAPDITTPGSTEHQNIAGVFDYVDEIFHQVIGDDKLVAIGVLIVVYGTTGMGWLISFLLMIGVGALLMAFFRIIITYAVSILALTFALMFTPFFLAFAMFEQTSSFFKAWLASIVSYTMQPIIVLAFIFLFAGVSDMTVFIQKLMYVDPNLPQPALDAPSNKKIQMDKQLATDLIFKKVGAKAPGFKDLTGNLGENTAQFLQDFKEGAFFALAFIILNSVMNALLTRIPAFAQMLSSFGGYRSAPILSGSPGEGWATARSPERDGVNRPEDFVSGTGIGKEVKGWVSRSEGIGAEILGRLFGGGGGGGPTVPRS